MPAAVLGPVAGAVVGGVMGGGKGGGSSQTASKEPWEPAAPWLRQQIQDGQDLERYYQRNPFNSLQQTGYQNLFSDIDNFRSNIAPGLMNFANGMMNSRYQRAPAGTELGASNPYSQQGMRPGPMTNAMPMGGQGGGLQGAMQGLSGMQGMSGRSGSVSDAYAQMPGAGESAPAGALMSAFGGLNTQGMPGGMEAMQAGQQGWNGQAVPMDKPASMDGGLLGQAIGSAQGNQGAFSMAPNNRSYGLLDFNALNPWTGILAQRDADKDKKPETDMTLDEQIEDYLRRRDPQGWQQWDESRRLGQGGA